MFLTYLIEKSVLHMVTPEFQILSSWAFSPSRFLRAGPKYLDFSCYIYIYLIKANLRFCQKMLARRWQKQVLTQLAITC